MLIDKEFFDAEKFAVTKVAQMLDKNCSTIWRWISRGVKGRKLRATRIAGRVYILAADLHDFVANGNADTAAPAARTPSAVRRAEKAEEELQRRGI